MTIKKMLLMLSLALAMFGCAVTPKIHLKAGDMTMEVNSKAPIVMGIAYSPDAKDFASGGFDGVLRLWDIEAGKLAKKIIMPAGHICEVKYSADGKSIITGDSSGFIRFWDAKIGTQTKQFSDYSCIGANAGSIILSSDSKYLLFRSECPIFGNDCTYTLLDTQTGHILRKYNGGSRDGAISSDGKYVHIGLGLYDLRTGRELWNLRRPKVALKFSLLTPTFSPDNRYIVSINSLFDVEKGTIVTSFEQPEQFILFRDASFFPDGRYFINPGMAYSQSGFSKGIEIVRIGFQTWDAQTGAMVRQFSLSDFESSAVEVKPSPAFSPDNKFVVTTTGSSLKFLNTVTGEEQATFIGFADGEWLVVSSNGYYNSSEKGDQYLSVTVGGKPYTISQLRESFYRPDLVKAALSGGSLKEFRKIADVKPPPAVEIVDTPKSINKDEAVINLKITDQGGGIGDIRLYLNGAAVVLDNNRGIAIVPTKNASDVYKKYTIKLTNGQNSIRAIAFNADNSMQSTDVVQEITASFKSLSKPSLYALVIGINEYKNPKLQLNNAVADAGLFADTLTKGASSLFDKIVVKRFLTTKETTKENIIQELQAMRSLNPDDLFVFYVASHGTVDDGEYFLITSNVGSTSTAKLKTDALSQNTLKELVANIPATKKLIVIDTCSAGKLGDAIQTAMLTRGMSEDTAMKVLSRAVGSTILSASTSVQEALEGYRGHGLFTFVLSEGLSGKADKSKTGFIKTTELADYVDNEVPVLAEQVFKKAQYPTISISGQGFPIGQVR